MLIVRRSSSRVAACFENPLHYFAICGNCQVSKFANPLSYFHVVKFPEYRASGLNNFAMLEPPGFETFQFRDVRVNRFLDLLIFK